MRTRSVRYPKLLTVEMDGRAVTRATKTRDIGGNRWTKQELTSVRKEFTRFCEVVIGTAIAQGDQARPWLHAHLDEISRDWDHYAEFSGGATEHALALRGKVDINGDPSYYVRLWADVDLDRLESLAKARHDA